MTLRSIILLHLVLLLLLVQRQFFKVEGRQQLVFNLCFLLFGGLLEGQFFFFLKREDIKSKDGGNARDILQFFAGGVQRGEDDHLSVVVLDLLVQFVDVSALVEIVIAEEVVTNQQFLHCLHLDAPRDLFLTVCHLVLIHLHHFVKFLEGLGLADGLGVFHLLHDGGIREDLIEAVEIAVGALGQHDLVQPLALALVVLLLQFGLDEPEQLVVEEARTGNDKALDALEVEGGDDVVALLEEFVERLAIDLIPCVLLRDVALDLLLEERDGLLDVAEVGHPFLHHHRSDLHPVLLLCYLLDEVDLVQRPFLLVNGDLGLQLDLEGVELPDLQKLIFLGIATLDADAQAVLLGEVIDLHDLQGEGEDAFADLLKAGDVGLVDDLAAGLHADVVALLDEVVDVPEVLVIGGHAGHVALAPHLLYVPPLNSHTIKEYNARTQHQTNTTLNKMIILI